MPKVCRGPVYLLIALSLMALPGVCGSAWSEEATTKQKKQYPDPHRLHLEARSESSADFSIDEIGDWPGLLRSLQGKGASLQLDRQTKMILGVLKPEGLSGDDKAIVINILNGLLLEKSLASRARTLGQPGGETTKLQRTYATTKEVAGLKWLNRSVLCDSFPQLTRKKRSAELKKITCATCHEAFGATAWGQLESAGAANPGKETVSEGAVAACISQAIAGKKTIDECTEMVKAVRRSRIEPYGPLKNIMQRADADSEAAFFATVHPESPYPFKPLLKRLVCLECHSQNRKVDKVMGSDGRVKRIKIFYGAGVGTNP